MPLPKNAQAQTSIDMPFDEFAELIEAQTNGLLSVRKNGAHFNRINTEKSPITETRSVEQILEDTFDSNIININVNAHTKQVSIIAKPKESDMLTPKQMQEMMDTDGHITGIVAVDLSTIINDNIESLNDLVSEALTGTELLLDINYEIIGIQNRQTILLQVTGDATDILTHL